MSHSQRKQSPELVAVDHVHPDHAEDISILLETAGLNPRYVDHPRHFEHITRVRGLTTTPIYVPEDEAEAARAVLADYYAQAERRFKAEMKGWWRPFIVPLAAAIALGVIVGVLTGQGPYGFAAAVIGFIVALKINASTRPAG